MQRDKEDICKDEEERWKTTLGSPPLLLFTQLSSSVFEMHLEKLVKGEDPGRRVSKKTCRKEKDEADFHTHSYTHIYTYTQRCTKKHTQFCMKVTSTRWKQMPNQIIPHQWPKSCWADSTCIVGVMSLSATDGHWLKTSFFNFMVHETWSCCMWALHTPPFF